MNKLRLCLSRWRLWLAVRLYGRSNLPARQRGWILRQLVKRGNPAGWSPVVLQQADLIPWRDLLNGPAGGEAYCGGILFGKDEMTPQLRHWRGQQAIDTPLWAETDAAQDSLVVPNRLFWCGPLTFHFGHQVADFGSRVLLASLDIRGGVLLWYPWRAANSFQSLLPWQRFLLDYLNPGKKPYWIPTEPIRAKEIVVYPQQAPMRSLPSPAHLEALGWCERQIDPKKSEVLYVSRARFAACRSADNLLGAYAGEELLEAMLDARGVRVIHPETLTLREQLEFYRGAKALIVAEGSAQHGIELLGFHGDTPLVVICRRQQREGMELPLQARFPHVQFVEALKEQWQAADGVAWDGLALLDWFVVAEALNPLLDVPLSPAECMDLQRKGEHQLQQLSAILSMCPVKRV